MATAGPLKHTLKIHDLHAEVAGKPILNGVSMEINSGELAAIMGPNGSGKSTLAYCLMGHPKYKVTSGTVTLDGKDLLSLPVDKRAKLGLFLGFQYPQEISGLSMAKFLWTAYAQRHPEPDIDTTAFDESLTAHLGYLDMDKSFLKRSLNEGFSGGEKKRSEILQMATFQPTFAILDEPDSGLDIDAVRSVGETVSKVQKESPEMGILVITHYQRILKYLNPDKVHVMVDGVVALSGGRELALELEAKGYDWVKPPAPPSS